MAAIREVQHPEPCEVPESRRFVASPVVQAASSQRGLAMWIRSAEGDVTVQNVHHVKADLQGLIERLGCHELEIVSRCVVLRKLAPDTPHQAPNGQIEPG